MDIARYDDYDVEVLEDDDFDLEYIDYLKDEPKEEEVYEKELHRETKLKELLLNLMSKQASLAITNGTIWAGETKSKIGKMIESVEQIAQQYEKDYISSRDGQSSILKEYEESVDQLQSWFERSKDKILEQIKEYQHEEQEAIKEKDRAIHEKRKIQMTKEYKQYLKNKKDLINEINNAIEEEDTEKEQIKRAELRELKRNNPTLKYNIQIKKADTAIEENRDKIADCKEDLKKIVEDKNNKLDEIENNKNDGFSGLVKQNFWQKLIGSVVNKFRRGKNIALEQIKTLTAKIKEECKKMSEKYEEHREERKEERDKVKAQKDEERKRRREAIINDIESRIAETEKKLEIARGQKAKNNEKNMTPVFESGNTDIVPFSRD